MAKGLDISLDGSEAGGLSSRWVRQVQEPFSDVRWNRRRVMRNRDYGVRRKDSAESMVRHQRNFDGDPSR
jgi:hypothetical protein